MVNIRVFFKGLFQDITGMKEERHALTDATLEGLVRALEKSYGKRFTEALRDPEKRLSPGVMALVNGSEFPGWETPLANADEVIFLHFIAGG